MRFSLVATILLMWLFGYSQTFQNHLESADSLNRWLNVSNIDSINAHSQPDAAFVDSLHPYGLGAEMYFPSEIRNKNTILTLKGFVFCDTVQPDALYVISIENRGETAFWKGIVLKKILIQKQTWIPFKDSVIIPANITKSGKLKIYLWNKERKNRILIDDLSISFKPYNNPSFLTDVDSLSEYIVLTKDTLLFENKFYQIRGKDDDGFYISDTLGTPVTNYIRYFFNEKYKQNRFSNFAFFKFVGVKTRKDKTLLTFKTASKFENIKLIVSCNRFSPKIDVTITQQFKKSVEVIRSALLVDYALPLSEVFRANRKSDTADFQSEYWLDKQGFSTANRNVAMTIYHCPDVSSLQLNTKNHLAVINLDYDKDHPFLHFPLDTNSFDFKVDRSASVYKRGDKIKKQFTFFVGTKPERLPRFMKNPTGFLATYIWTEHADWGDIRTHRATYFGSEKITVTDSAKGGFIKYGIPVTKSVFYDNPDSITNTIASGGLFTTLESAIKADTAYAAFLDQIYKKGNEICLHTPEQFTTNPERLAEALKYMKNHFQSLTWIDHGYNNLKKNNREDFVCDGMHNFAASLWKKYGIKYFWNPYYEDYQTFLNRGFFGSIEKMYSGFGDYYPKPDYWKHPTQTNGFYHWPTFSVLYMGSEGLWNYFFSPHQFRVFVNDWAVEINHCYPAWTKPGKGLWKYAADSTIVAMEGFNRTLALMQSLKQKGLLNVTTVREFLNYRLATQQVSYQMLADGRIKVTNTSAKLINGLSYAVKAKAVLVNGLRPAQKQADNDLIFWFNLKPGHSALIRVVE